MRKLCLKFSCFADHLRSFHIANTALMQKRKEATIPAATLKEEVETLFDRQYRPAQEKCIWL